jgi:hypothetical protein
MKKKIKKKITYALTTIALISVAFILGNKNANRQIDYIPVEDIAVWYINDGYITMELKDVNNQFDDKSKAAYTDILSNTPYIEK